MPDEYNGMNGIPQFMKLIMIFVDRVGFPILAFVLMFYMAFIGINKMTTALEKTSTVLSELVVFEKTSQDAVLSTLKLVVDNQCRSK